MNSITTTTSFDNHEFRNLMIDEDAVEETGHNPEIDITIRNRQQRRQRFTPIQLADLKKEFSRTNYPDIFKRYFLEILK